jgi:poly(3-hydroxybutyrate) depolymerase
LNNFPQFKQYRGNILLYAMQDASKRAMTPLAALAAMGTLFGHFPGAENLPFFKETQAGFRLLGRLTKTYDKPRFNIERANVNGEAVAVTELAVEVLPFCKLLHFRKEMKNPGPKLLIVAPLSGHHATLLRATVESMLESHDVYITDWLDAREIPVSAGEFDLSSYTSYVQRFIRTLGEGVHVLGVCQPCVPALAAVSLMEQNKEKVVPKTLTLISGPVDVRMHPTAVNKFASEHGIDFFRNRLIERVPAGYLGAGRKVYPGFMQLAGFVLMNKDKHTQAYQDFYKAVQSGDEGAAAKHESFYDEYNAVLDMPAEYYLETIEKVFLTSAMAEGKLELCGQLVRPESITRTALMTIEGDKDDICGIGQTHSTQTLCSSLPDSMRGSLTVEGAGHFGSFSGKKFKATALPAITEFIRSHS